MDSVEKTLELRENNNVYNLEKESHMEKVENLILYQVATDRYYKIGDKIIFDSTTNNGQYERVFNSTFQKNNKGMSDFVYSSANKKFLKIKRDDLYDIAHCLDFYDVAIKELALEEVRKELFPIFPSRLHCMYLSISKDIVLQNMKSMINSNEKKRTFFQAIAVKLNGNIFKTGKINILREGQSYNYYKNKAKDYWSQTDVKDDEIKEILFEGTAEVIEIFDECSII